jgi:hypothetical protein
MLHPLRGTAESSARLRGGFRKGIDAKFHGMKVSILAATEADALALISYDRLIEATGN